jgi:1-acylglycerone phosphate reductase
VYNASKAAVFSSSETWRYELEPLGVRVITLRTGVVKTRFMDNLPQMKLPDDSYYIGARHFIERGGDRAVRASGMEPKTYAEKVFAEVDKGASGIRWIGAYATLARFLHSLAPQWMVVS